jgi:hypothetical protein
VVTDEQVRLLRQKRMKGKSQESAAAAAGMSVRTARKWEASGALPSASKPLRSWRTRPDPFVGVWDEEIVPLLLRDTERILQATTLLDLLEARYPGRFDAAQLRTLQRRMRDWRAVQGPDREVYFERIAGAPFEHLLFEFVLSFSGWRWVCLAYGETFEALVDGLQGALWELGGVPEIARSDNLSAATHELKRSGGRALNERFASVLEHYGLRSTRIHPGRSHENGIVEQAHYRLKSALAQALVIRGSRDFETVAAYEAFVQEVVGRLNRPSLGRLAEERPYLRALPSSRVPAYTVYRVMVRKWSTIRISNKTYSVPSRLRGHTVEVRQFANKVEVLYQGTVVEQMPRLRGGREHRIDYRHVIWSLVHKPGAFARYRYREELFPTPVFREAYDALSRFRGERADVDYVRTLHLAASTLECTVERSLRELLSERVPFDYATIRERAVPTKPPVPELATPAVPDLRVFDALLAEGSR